MNLGLIGAGGFVGSQVLEAALARGHTVTALVRRPDAVTRTHERLRLVTGDTFTPASLDALVRGQDAVVTVAGPPQAKHDSAPFERAAQTLVQSMTTHGVQRLITIAGAAARLPGEALGFKRGLLRLVLENIVMPDVIRTKDLEVAAVAASSLRWTIVRPPRIGSGGASGGVVASDTDLAGVKVDVVDIADFIVRCLDSDEWVRRAPTVASR